MSYVYDRNKSKPERKPNYWCAYTGMDGEQVREGTGCKGETAAKRYLALRERQVRAGTWRPRAEGSAPLLRDYAVTHSARRVAQGVKTAADESSRLETYWVPELGRKRLDLVTRRDVKRVIGDLVAGRMAEGKIAPRTVHHVHEALRQLFVSAIEDEHVMTNPCTLKVRRGELPGKKDKDPAWRAGAQFSRGEVVALLTDERIPEDRRVLYALQVLGAMRFGEAAGRRWRDYDPMSEPLGRLSIHSQYDGEPLKTERPREMPVHPVLAQILNRWRMKGWAALFCRTPRPDDWIVPNRQGRVRLVSTGHEQLQADLEEIGLRRRRQHDMRRTLISLARGDGADPGALKAGTHGGSGDIIDQYTTWEWGAQCRAVASLQLTLPTHTSEPGVRRAESRAKKDPGIAMDSGVLSGDPNGTRTRVTGVRGRCPNR